ncbi:MAG: HRDC domain-containing protein [FCB group bacterium]|jgi:ribonuclease D|nr:HRDC domain-containing protein [FCB group bacterium]
MFDEKTADSRTEIRNPYTYVTTEPVLAEVVARMKHARRIALDIEANSLYQYHQKVCLIQLTANGEDYIVDPLVGLDLADFLQVLANKPLIVHGADYDLRMMRQSLEFLPRQEVFDTMSAAQLLGFEHFSLAALAERYLGLHMTKRNQKSNWSQRPLTDKQLEYACDDTHYLESIAQVMETELVKLDRLGWLHEICARTAESAAEGMRPDYDADEAWRIKGAAFLAREPLAYVREIWQWREREAQKLNRPPFKVFGNSEVLELAQWAAANKDKPLAEWPRLPRYLAGRRIEGLERAVKKARALPSAEWPPQRRPRSVQPPQPDCRNEVEALQAECRRLAEELGIAPSVLAPRAAITAVARSRPQTPDEAVSAGLLLPWQAQVLKPALQKIFGKRKSK